MQVLFGEKVVAEAIGFSPAFGAVTVISEPFIIYAAETGTVVNMLIIMQRHKSIQSTFFIAHSFLT